MPTAEPRTIFRWSLIAIGISGIISCAPAQRVHRSPGPKASTAEERRLSRLIELYVDELRRASAAPSPGYTARSVRDDFSKRLARLDAEDVSAGWTLDRALFEASLEQTLAHPLGPAKGGTGGTVRTSTTRPHAALRQVEVELLAALETSPARRYLRTPAFLEAFVGLGTTVAAELHIETSTISPPSWKTEDLEGLRVLYKALRANVDAWTAYRAIHSLGSLDIELARNALIEEGWLSEDKHDER